VTSDTSVLEQLNNTNNNNAGGGSADGSVSGLSAEDEQVFYALDNKYSDASRRRLITINYQ